MKSAVASLIMSAMAGVGPAYAAAPDALTYQGVLQESGVAAEGSRSVEILVCDAESGGNCYTSGAKDVSAAVGVLRSTVSWPGGADPEAGPWWVETRIGGSPLLPRRMLTSVPYALWSGTVTMSANVSKTGDAMSGNLDLVGNKVVNLADPGSGQEAATKAYVDSWTRSCANPADPSDAMAAVGDMCVDKYEASVWSSPTGGTQYGGSADDYPCQDNGQNCVTTPIYARSVSGVTPSRYITWFQAAAACENAGKRLLSNAQWQAAARGTPDPGAGVAFPGCNVNSHSPSPSVTGGNTGCRSSYDAENMVGSLWEWVGDWYIAGQHYNGAPTNWADGTATTGQWPDGTYGADGSWNVAGRSYNGAGYVNGLPAAGIRGGFWVNGSSAGVFAFPADAGPSHSASSIGFRCGRGR